MNWAQGKDKVVGAKPALPLDRRGIEPKSAEQNPNAYNFFLIIGGLLLTLRLNTHGISITMISVLITINERQRMSKCNE